MQCWKTTFRACINLMSSFEKLAIYLPIYLKTCITITLSGCAIPNFHHTSRLSETFPRVPILFIPTCTVTHRYRRHKSFKAFPPFGCDLTPPSVCGFGTHLTPLPLFVWELILIKLGFRTRLLDHAFLKFSDRKMYSNICDNE